MPENEIVGEDFFAEPVSPTADLAPLQGDMGKLQQAAEFLSQSTIIPAAYQNKPANVFIAMEFAQRIGCNFMTVAQNLDIIQGKPSWSSKFLISVANECGKYTPIRYEMLGEEDADSWGCRAYMTEISTGDKLTGPKITIKMANGRLCRNLC
jgi:hypothetical protein